MTAAALILAREGDAYDVLTPSLLACIGRELVRRGESLHLIKARAGLMLTPCASWDVYGTHDPATWRYDVELAGPSQTVTMTRPGAAVLHCRWSTPPSRPWIGEGPLDLAGLSSELLSSLETRLGQEAAALVAQVIPSPSSGDETATLRTAIKDAKGGLALVPTMAGGGWTGDRAAAPVRILRSPAPIALTFDRLGPVTCKAGLDPTSSLWRLGWTRARPHESRGWPDGGEGAKQRRQLRAPSYGVYTVYTSYRGKA